MPAQWLSNSGEIAGRVSTAATSVVGDLSQPANARRLRQIVLLILAVWIVLALARLAWALLPGTNETMAPPPNVINPVSTSAAAVSADPVNINRMIGWHLFGEAGAEAVSAPVQEEIAAASARDGIEKGARETRLNLTLRGIVASTADGLGHAIIEYKSKQDVYAVEDKLPVPGRVLVAKVMPRQVVLDNGGTYELLVLFDDSKLGSNAAAPARPIPKPAPAKVDRSSDDQTTELAAGYMKRLYQDPQSLSRVVGVSAVREGGALVGYRVSPGQDREQFTQLGFKTGDLVKSVNGIDLSSPANTMRLYNVMRTASEAVFEVERNSQPMTLTVSLGQDAP